MCDYAEKQGDKTAIAFKERLISYRDLWQQVQDASTAISAQLDNHSQQVVAILAPNSPEFVISYLAVVHSGHIAFPLDISFKELEINSVLAAVQPALVLTLRDLRHLTEGKAVLIEDILAAKPTSFPTTTIKSPPEEQIATLFLSSGTTGQPKAIPNTHANILWDIEAIATPMGWTAKDNVLITLHLSHRHGLVICLLGALYHGNTVYLEERFNPQRTLEMLESGKISLYSAVPSIYESLIDYRPEQTFDLGRVRLFASSSSPLPPFLRRAFKQRFGRQILDRYGTSETGSVAIRQSSDKEPFDVILDGVKLRLEANGEVALKSPGLFPGYYRNDKATRQNLTPDGWWLIGDIGKLNKDGLVLKGRTKERIIKSGYSIYPQDIEWAMQQNNQVKEIRVIGIPSVKHIDDEVVAFYTGPAERRSLEDYARSNLPRSWRPDRFVHLRQLPKGHTNKVQLSRLQEIAKAKHE